MDRCLMWWCCSAGMSHVAVDVLVSLLSMLLLLLFSLSVLLLFHAVDVLVVTCHPYCCCIMVLLLVLLLFFFLLLLLLLSRVVHVVVVLSASCFCPVLSLDLALLVFSWFDVDHVGNAGNALSTPRRWQAMLLPW